MDLRNHESEPIRVILAEDHALVREGTRRILEGTDHIVVVAEAADGREAVAAVDHHDPDVAIIDIGMPELNGIEATRRIKRGHPRVSVLILTVHDDDQFIFAVLEAGAAGYLLKDVAGHQLIQAVDAIHAGESVLHPAITHKVLARVAARGDVHARSGAREPLTGREHKVLRMAARGMANRQIGAALDVSVMYGRTMARRSPGTCVMSPPACSMAACLPSVAHRCRERTSRSHEAVDN